MTGRLTVKQVMSGERRCITHDEAPASNVQHMAPCGDCPFVKGSLKGWIGGMSTEEWSETLRGDGKIHCHAIRGPQCVGAAIMRANMCKRPKDPSVLQMPAKTGDAFVSLEEFKKHHTMSHVV